MELQTQNQVLTMNPRQNQTHKAEVVFETGDTDKTAGIQIPPDYNFHASVLLVTARDAEGKILEDQIVRDKITTNISNGKGIAKTDSPIDIFSLNKLAENPIHKGWFMVANEEIKFEVSRDIDTAVNAAPVTVEFIMFGHQVSKEVSS